MVRLLIGGCEQGQERPFITFNALEPANDKTRKLIRSHVMLQKNQGRSIKRGARWRDDHAQVETSPPDHSSQVGSMPVVGLPNIAPKVGSDVSLVRFAADVAPHLLRDLLKCNDYSHRWHCVTIR